MRDTATKSTRSRSTPTTRNCGSTTAMASSGRPIWHKTARTSGYLVMVRRAMPAVLLTSSSEIFTGNVLQGCIALPVDRNIQEQLKKV